MPLLKKIWWYLSYLARARSLSSIQDPAARELFSQVLSHSDQGLEVRISKIRQHWKGSDLTVSYQDLGAGRGDGGGGQVTRRVQDLIRISSRDRREGQLLHHLCKALQPQVSVELGTHLGISTLYQYSGCQQARWITIEGAAPLTRLARNSVKQFDPGLQPEFLTGNFDDILPPLLKSIPPPDYCLIDGNHRYEPTIRYARWLIDAMTRGGVIVLDDIYWSAGMRAAWKDIISWPEVALSADLFSIGILMIGQTSGQEKQEHVTLRWS